MGRVPVRQAGVMGSEGRKPRDEYRIPNDEGSTPSPAPVALSPPRSLAPSPPRPAHRLAEVAAFVALWMALGWALHLGPEAYLAIVVPLVWRFFTTKGMSMLRMMDKSSKTTSAPEIAKAVIQ